MTTLNRICMKRLMNDIRMLDKDPFDCIDYYVDQDNMLQWHFLLHSDEKNKFDAYTGGEYIGKILHHPEYPFKPPDFMMLTPNGRFVENKKICLSNTGYHSNEWSAMWNIKSILVGFLSIFLDDDENGISHIHRPESERICLAKQSIDYNKKHHKELYENLLQQRVRRLETLKKLEEKKKKKEIKKLKKNKEKESSGEIDESSPIDIIDGENVGENVSENVQEDIKEDIKEVVKEVVKEDDVVNVKENTKEDKKSKKSKKATDKHTHKKKSKKNLNFDNENTNIKKLKKKKISKKSLKRFEQIMAENKKIMGL